MAEDSTLAAATAKNPWRELRFLIGLVSYYFLITPLVYVILVSALIVKGYFPYTKGDLENIALLVCFSVTAACMIKFFIARHLFYLWCFGLSLTIFVREVHFAGTSAAVYFSLLLHLFVALHLIDKFREHLRQPVFLTTLATGFSCYFVSQSIDQRWWRGFPYEIVVHVPLEESLEVFGHLIVGLTLLCWFRYKPCSSEPLYGKTPETL